MPFADRSPPSSRPVWPLVVGLVLLLLLAVGLVVVVVLLGGNGAEEAEETALLVDGLLHGPFRGLGRG
ncbi:MAG: hypothetical protein EA352_11815 [Gemmatimonadales bacterium]|nr:MAG: hypothetical protein EA352_11815 [Gemmatimonadales bacterium]